MKRASPSRALGVLLGLVAVCGLPACGGGSSSPAAPVATPPPTPPPPQVVLTGGQAVPAGVAVGDVFSVSRAGTIDATIDYTFVTNTIVVWIATGTCTPATFNAGQCSFIGTSLAGPKPRRVSVTNTPVGDYVLIIGNAGPADDSVSYQVMLTPNAGTGSVQAARAPRVSEPFRVQLPAR